MLLSKNAIQRVPISKMLNRFYSRCFVVPKKDGGIRPILDLRALSTYLQQCHFSMTTLESIIHPLHQKDWFIVIDLQDTYFHISIHRHHRKYLSFFFKNTTFQFCALPFGLSTAPHTFTKCMVPMAAYLRLHDVMVLPYSEDWLVERHLLKKPFKTQNSSFILWTVLASR